MEGGGQLRLLLWRDYLIRKRKFVTLAGILWATGIMFGIYAVRINIDNEDVPSCQFAARALPSAGMMPFLQSFICSVNNECKEMDQFEEIPSYQKAKLTQMKSKLAPLLNETVLDLAGTMPDAIKLLATVANVADDPTFIDFSKNGLKSKDLFNNPSRVKRYVTSHMQLDDDVAQSLMTSEISFQGILNGNLDRCSVDSIAQTLVVPNSGHLEVITSKLCGLTKQDMQTMLMDLMYEVNFSKYIKMLGNMYTKISGDDRISKLGDFVTAILRMTKLQNFLPPEALGIFYGKKADFSYMHLDLIKKFMDLFEPTYGATKEYQSIREFVDTAVMGLQYMNKIFGNISNDTEVTIASGNVEPVDEGLSKINKVLDNAVEAVSVQSDAIDPFNVLAKLANIITKFLPTHKHDFLFYSTLLAKLMESSSRVIDINMHIQEITYNVTLRNSNAINALKRIPPLVVGKAFDALVNSERTQILTSNLNNLGHMFCDVSKLQNFLLISKTEVESVKSQLCSDAWKNYVSDLVTSLGVFDVRNNINEMASLLIQETLGKDTSSQLYTIEKDFQILRNFSRALTTMASEKQPEFDWKILLGITDDDELMKVVNEKAHLGKLMLISVHGALAKEIVKQNLILQYKLNPILLNTYTLVAAFNEQLDIVPGYVSEGVKQEYVNIVTTMLMTAYHEEKTYKALSTYCEDIFCNGGDIAANYLEFPNEIDVAKTAEVLCNASLAIEDGLKNDSVVSKAIAKIMNTTHTSADEVNWTKLINNIQQLYVKLDRDYPYLFEFSTYAMDNITQANLKEMFEDVKDYWFGIRNLQRGLHLSANLGFRLVNLMDHGIFNMTSENWLKMKFFVTKIVGPLVLIDDTVKLVTALITNSSYTSGLPPITVDAMEVIIPKLPQLMVDAVNIIIHDDTDIQPIISLMNASPPWPCSSSITQHLELTSSSKEAVFSMETLLCMNRDLQEEWMEYLTRNKVTVNKTLAWNTTQYDPHLFLNMSSLFNAMINDVSLVQDAFQYIVSEESSENLGLMKAWKYFVDTANSTDGKEMIRRFLSKFDTVLDSIETSVNTNVSLNALWERYLFCVNGSYIDGCRDEGRAVWKKALQVISVICATVSEDMITYFTEVNAPDYNLLQLVGFTKNTAMYMLYDKLPEFMGVLINSYFDYGFMSQVRRASSTQFWDCDALVSALTPGPGSPIQLADITRVRPFICPSIIYWLSLPRDDNVLFNIVAKPQYYFYSFPVENATSSFERAFTKSVYLADFITNIPKENTSLTDELKIDKLKSNLATFIDNMLNYRLKGTDDKYIKFNDINKKHFISTAYLTRVVAILNKLATAITELSIDEEFIVKENIDQDDVAKITSDLAIMKNVFKRRAFDAIAMHYDVLTDVLWRNDDKYTLIDAMDASCRDLKENHTKVILVEELRTKTQICAKNYRVLYGAVINEVVGDYDDARQSLLKLVKILQNGDESDVTDVFEFLNNRTELVNSVKYSIKYAYDLGLPIYLKYLQSNLQGYNVLLTFLSGGDWWEDLRNLYNGPKATRFLEILEQWFEITDNVLDNLDGIHLVRLIRDMKMNESDACRNITLSDYIPDSTGSLSELKQQVCTMDKVELFRELPPLLFSVQGYESSLTISKDVDYTALYIDISNIESNIDLIAKGPQEPLRPYWVTDDKLDQFRTDVLNLLSRKTLTKITFGVLSNSVDAGTLFLNNSDCTLCSQMTTWFKQLNLQLFKKQEYDNLLCHLNTMSLDDIHYTLKNDFHWDMFIRELISSRNYTNFELNKSLNEFLGQVEVHLLDDMRTPTTKLTECLAQNVSRNEFGNATLFLQVFAHAAKLLRAETPHIHQVEGITDLPYLKQLYNDVANRLSVYKPLKEYLKGELNLGQVVNDDEVVLDVMEADLNLLAANNRTEDIEDLIRLNTNKWEHICADHDCGDIFTTITDNLNKSKIEMDLPTLQTSEFWHFSFISSILNHIEGILSHTARLSGVASTMNITGVVEGRLAPMLDVLAKVLMDENVDSILFSLEGLISELKPLLKRTALDADLQALSSGLKTLHQFKTYLVEEADLRLKVATYFPNSDAVESGLNALGINNTNFWSLDAQKIHAGYLQMKPVLASKDQDFHINHFVCDIDAMSQVLSPGEIDVVSAEEVSAATVEQFCNLDEDIAKEMVMVLMGNANFTPIIDKVKEHLLSKLYSASDLTPDQGSEVLERFPRMAALLPTLQSSLGDIMEDLGNEPLFEDLKDFSSVGNLMSSSDFLANAGNMMCGAPFRTNMNRVIGNIIKSKDQAGGASQAQLDVLPTEFCRSMYRDIISMDGGKIVWSFVKPLLMGKILYTPNTPQVQKIIEKANSSFASMIQMTSLVHSLSSAFPSLEDISSHREGISALQQLISSEGMAALRKQVLGDVKLEVNVESVFKKFDLKSMGKLISKASDLLTCINLNRFVATTNETTLMYEAARLSMVNEFSAGLVFMNEDKLDNDFSNVEYKIRMDIDNAPTTSRMHAYLWIPGPESSFIENMRYFRGFIQIQDMVDKAIIQLSSEAARGIEHSGLIDSREMMEGSRKKREVVEEEDWAVYTQQEPYPCYRKDFFQTSLYESQALLMGLLFSLMFTVTSAVRFIVADKESGNTMLMSVMGVNLNYHTLSWFITSFVELFLTEACVVAVLRGGGILPRSDPTLLLAILLLYGISVLSFCYLMSKLFSSASSAAVCVGIAYLVTFMPFVIILSLEAVMSPQLKLVVCLSMSSSLSYAFLFVSRFEAMGRGVGWADIWASPTEDNMSIAAAMSMVLFDIFLYLFLGWLIDRYYGIRAIRSSITTTSENDKAGVSIVKVCKTYSPGSRRAKVVLDNVSIELHKGQITTLLGHNGAGKTTLTNILTGMLRPSSGHVVLRGGGRVGVCPQHDVLVECLTTREHISLYAQLSTGDRETSLKEVDRMLSVLSLGAVADEQVSRLSGGTRRRVCVALAFVAQPALVSLDEPTSGVDPKARREIWDMIVKLKEDRTILLTTHHLDEAEILSDQIIIMHKGKVHTSGTPIEIKRSLGSGYKLTINLPDRRDDWSAEERTKSVVAVVREVVKNAYVADFSGALEMVLPLYDADGANNNFLQLSTTLEQQQQTLGFSSYTLDCCSLEQVFCDICLKADTPQSQEYNIGNDNSQLSKTSPSKSGSSSSVRSESLVPCGGPRRGPRRRQLLALLRARYLHLSRNRWLLFMLIALPTLFVTISMAFSLLRPPIESEINLRLGDNLYSDSTQYLVPNPSVHSDIEPTLAQHVMALLKTHEHTKNWNEQDTPQCKCLVTRLECQIDANMTRPEMMSLPNVDTLNNWIVSTHDSYIEKRYNGFTSTLSDKKTNLIAWYNNKGYHAMPASVNKLNNAILRAVAGTNKNITTYSHPLQISEEQLSKDTVFQRVADAGVCALVLIAYCVAAAGGAVPLVGARQSKEKRLQLLSGVSLTSYWACALLWDMMIIFINMMLTAAVMRAFGFPVFVERHNLAAICILLILFGYACCSMMHVFEKMFSSASLANMMMFCGSAFLGLAGLVVLIILDIISESDATDNARWVLHKIFMLFPQFALVDGMLEIAKNTIQAQVLYRFGMDTYKNPLNSDLILLHICYLIVVGTAMLLLNLAIEYGYFEALVTRWNYQRIPDSLPASEPEDVSAERRRVAASMMERDDRPLSLSTIGNINRGFVHTEGKKNSLQRSVVTERDVAQCVAVSKAYRGRGDRGLAVNNLTMGIAPGQCMALLGENGAGKSTVFSMLSGEIQPTRGQIFLDGKERDTRGLCRGLISYCPQSDAIDPLLTVEETLQIFCRLRGIDEEEDVIERAIEMFDLSKYASVRSGALSGGNKRKLCTAIAFMARTPLVLLDEPTSGMDPVSRGCVCRGARSAALSRRGVLLSTHALDDARNVASRVALMRLGKLIAVAPLDECLQRYGGGYLVQCACADARAAWQGVTEREPRAALRVIHRNALHFHVPAHTSVDGKDVVTRLSDIFRLMSELQATCDIQDYTVNQSSLEQMFLSFSDKSPLDETVEIEPLPHSLRRNSEPLDSITSL